jgi:two-component system response regulator HydG
MAGSVLIIDDEESTAIALRDGLRRFDLATEASFEAEDAIARLRSRDTDVVLLDLCLPGASGIDVCRRVAAQYPGTAVIVMSARGSIDSAVAAGKAGAHDFITKPLEIEAIALRIRHVLHQRSRVREAPLPTTGSSSLLVGSSPAMARVQQRLARVAASEASVLIVGESGTGKELVARALHDHGPRKAGPFVAINCSAVPEPLLESELFGHVRGAFTGADRDRRGLFEVADGGTLLLDEIADTSAAMQAKLLRVLQDGMIRRVGDTNTRQVDVRVIAATQHPLGELVAAGRFREDLRFRLEVIAIAVPPLRDRDGDLPLLIDQLLARLAPGRPAPRLTRAALRALGQHRWPGNVRELENALARGGALGGDVIDVADLPEAIASAAGRPEPVKPAAGDDLRLKPALAATEQAYITAAMARTKGNQTVAARLLGLSRFGLQKKLRRLAGEDPGDDDA